MKIQRTIGRVARHRKEFVKKDANLEKQPGTVVPILDNDPGGGK